MFQTLLLTVIFVTSGVGVVALLRRFSRDRENPTVRAGATIAGVCLWLGLWLLTWIEPQLDMDRVASAGCVSGSEVDETLKRPVVLVRTRLGGDYVAIDASRPGQLRIDPQVTGGYATVDLNSGKASAMASGGAILLCNGNGQTERP